jgi:uncharacterized Rossmann fold enzyme
MNLAKWLRFYDEIIREFGFSKENDRDSASLLNTFLKRPDLEKLENLVNDKEVNIFGSGPSLEKLESLPTGINIAADGTCSFLMERGVVPDIVVTDLDGDIDDLLAANEKGALIIIHAHGDNIDKVKRYGRRFKNPYGTTQGEPFGNLLNFGGFTDGDRAGFIAEHFKPKKITFYGMDFDEMPGKYSFTKKEDVETKMKKLVWAKRLIEFLRRNSRVEIVLAKTPVT